MVQGCFAAGSGMGISRFARDNREVKFLTFNHLSEARLQAWGPFEGLFMVRL